MISTAPPKITAAPPLRRDARAILLVALALGVCFDWFFDSQPLGLGFPLFVALLLGSLLALSGSEGRGRVWRNAWLGLPLAIFAELVCIRANPLATVCNVLACVALALLWAHLHSGERLHRIGIGRLCGLVPFTAWRALTQGTRWVARDLEGQWARTEHRRIVRSIQRGLLIALPALLLFAVLLFSADAVFASLLEALFRLDFAARVGLALAVAVVTAGYLAWALRRGPKPRIGVAEPRGSLESAGGAIGAVEAITIVCLVDGLFAAFVAVQIWVFFRGPGGSAMPPGITYAEYAHRGFFQLLAVTAVAFGLILGLDRWTRIETRKADVAFGGARTAMVGLVLVIVASALRRMALYELAYGFTRLRLAAQVVICALALLLLWRAVTFWWHPEHFALGALGLGLLALVGFNLVNPDAFIARADLARLHAGKPCDFTYLAGLSADATPVLVANLSRMPPFAAAEIERSISARVGADDAGWQSFHFARARERSLWTAFVSSARPEPVAFLPSNRSSRGGGRVR